MKTITIKLTPKKYAEQQIRKCLTEAVIYDCQIVVVSRTLEDEDKKENAMKALTALTQQVEASNEQLKAWSGFLRDLKKESLISKIKTFIKKYNK